MVTYAVEELVQAGFSELMLVTGGTHAGDFFRLLGNGQEYGIERPSTPTRSSQEASRRRSGLIRSLHYHERGQDDLLMCLNRRRRWVTSWYS